MRLLKYFLIAILLAVRPAAMPALMAQTINATVDPMTVLVTNYEGWGTSLCWWANVCGGYANRTNCAALAFTTLKLNIVRYNVGGGENPNIPNTLQYCAQIPGFEPANGVWNWNVDTKPRWIASHLATVVSNLTMLGGIHFELVTPMNEPEGPWGYGSGQEGCHMESGQQARLAKDLSTAPAVQNLATGIDAPETCAEGDAASALNAYGSAVNNASGCGFLLNPLDGSGNTAYTINENFYVMGQFSQYTRPGFQIMNVNAGSALAPGNPLGALTISNNLTLASGSTTFMQVQHSPLTNDAAAINGTLTEGGTLTLTNSGGAASLAGDSFKLFSAASYAGAFAGFVLPPLMGNLVWNTNTLKTSGTLSVVTLTSPVSTGLKINGGQLVINGSGWERLAGRFGCSSPPIWRRHNGRRWRPTISTRRGILL